MMTIKVATTADTADWLFQGIRKPGEVVILTVHDLGCDRKSFITLCIYSQRLLFSRLHFSSVSKHEAHTRSISINVLAC